MSTLNTNISFIKNILSEVTDPEIPVLTIEDLGVLRNVEWIGGKLVVTITPTYSGCPAMGMIEKEIYKILEKEGYDNVLVKTVLAPAWTTDWLSEEGKQKLEKYGIAPPAETTADKKILLGKSPVVRCPQCKSTNTEMKSQFGSTACKSLYQCKDCKEPFDYFKCI